MKMTYKEQLIPINKYNKITKSRRCGIILYTVGFITAHDTGNPYSTAQNNVDYFCRTYKDDSASAHIFVDDKECIVCIPAFLNAERAHHVLYNKTKDNELFGDDANDMSIGVECCYFPNDKIRTLKAYNNYINVIVDLMEFHKINSTELTEHETLDANKQDPSNMLKIIGKTIGEFEMDVEKEYESRLTPTWEEILEICLDQPSSWIKAIDTLKEMAELSSSLGDLEIIKYIDELIEKVYAFGKASK